jgi:cell shape-determining protein MreC
MNTKAKERYKDKIREIIIQNKQLKEEIKKLRAENKETKEENKELREQLQVYQKNDENNTAQTILNSDETAINYAEITRIHELQNQGYTLEQINTIMYPGKQ